MYILYIHHILFIYIYLMYIYVYICIYMYLYIYDEGQSFQLKLQNEFLSQICTYLYGP